MTFGTTRRATATAILAIVILGVSYAAAQPGQAPALESTVDLLASVEAVVPGEPFEVALRLQMPPGWHTYWKNSGDSGEPPRVTWTLPSGFTAGELRFPIPKRHLSAGNIVTDILDGQPILLTRIKPPDVILDQEVSFRADMTYLVCQTTCLIKQTERQISLRVAPAGGEARAANEELFGVARRLLPKDESQYLSAAAKIGTPTSVPGRPFELLLDVDIHTGYHIQSHEPLRPEFVASDVFFERVEGISFKDAAYPPPRFRTLPYVGRVSEYTGSIQVRVTAEVDADAGPGQHTVAGLLKYQACDEKGTCFPPDALAFSTSVSVTDRTAAAAGQDIASQPSAAKEPPAASGEFPSGDDSATKGQGPTVAPAQGDSLGGLLDRFGLAGLLAACFLYGLFINATPCVLPILSIKVVGFVHHAHESRRRTLGLAVAFGAGVMVLFVVLGILAATGRNVLQYPGAVIGLGAVVTALALSMLGVYTLHVPAAAAKLDERLRKEGPLTSFGKGAIAPVLGFACTGPLLAGAFAFATQQSPAVAIVCFALAGLGMASPYMLLGANPHWLSFVPKPGAWMITFERIMGFLLLGMVVLLLHPLITQIGAEGLEWTLVFLLAVAAACWIVGQVNLSMSTVRRWAYRCGAALVVAVSGGVIYAWAYPLDEALATAQARTTVPVVPAGLGELANGENGMCPIPWELLDPKTANESVRAGDTVFVDFATAYCAVCDAVKEAVWEKGVPWQPWSVPAAEEAVRSGKIVFVDFTAAYCTQCKTNKLAAINTQEVRDKMRALGVVPFKADFTTYDHAIAAVLEKHGRRGVPLNLIYPAGKPDAPIVLGTQLTKEYVLEMLDQAAAAGQTAKRSRQEP